MERFWKYKIDHVIFWAATVFFHMFTRVQLIPKAGIGQFLSEIIVRNGLLALVIYANLFVLIPRFGQQKRWPAYLGSLVLLFIFYVAAKNTHDVYLYGYVIGDVARRYFFYNTLYNFSIAVFYMAFSVALQLSREWYAQREMIRKIEIEKLNTELEYLKSQINPHFLFNSINTIYFQIDKKNTTARETLSAFSEMLRYQLYECNGKEILVEKEVAYLKNYVDLQRIRKDENYHISFLHDDDLKGFSIAPLLLITFVENAFKHVSHHQERNEIRISLSRKDNVFELNVFNTRDSNYRADAAKGIGLRNVQRRLELLYNGRHELFIRENAQSFEVDLRLKIV
ncbi:MAG: sensor histidine kinase [Bacteroidota bacterium]